MTSSSSGSSGLVSNLTQSSMASYTSTELSFSAFNFKFISDDSEYYDSEEEFDVDYSCPDCSRPRTNDRWCNFCESEKFSKNFNNWTSGHSYLDEIIKDTQLNATSKCDYLVWIDYNEFEDVEYLANGGFGDVYFGIWINGPEKVLIYDEESCIHRKEAKTPVALKCLRNSENITTEFLDENRGDVRERRNIRSHPKASYTSKMIPKPPSQKDIEYSGYSNFAVSESEFTREITGTIGKLPQLTINIDEKGEDFDYVTRAFNETLSF
ncbi:9129_t:CDS:2, partial [Dentiscutata erythropus]